MQSRGALENIEEDTAAEWLPVVGPQPETPTESMEFLARSWSVSAVELSKALCNTADEPNTTTETHAAPHGITLLSSLQQNKPAPESPPRGSDDAKELLLLHQSLSPDNLSNQQLLRNGFYRSIMKKKTAGRWNKDQKERKKHEIRAHNAQLHAAVSVAAVAAAVAALASSPEKSTTKRKKSSPITPAAIASAAALVASHCMEMAEEMGAERDHILSIVNSAIKARSNGDVMTLTAGAATALRGAAALRARLHNENGGANITRIDENIRKCKEPNVSVAISFVSKGGELLKRTRKGDLHWKEVSININSNWKVVAKMKSKHMGGTFTKKKKCVISGIYGDVKAWVGREAEMGYFGVQSVDRVIEFECRNKGEMQMWVEGIQHMLHLSEGFKL